jgi:serine/threonine-protein kinase/endoribonuclease IRE1
MSTRYSPPGHRVEVQPANSQLLESSTGKVFARKLISISLLKLETIENEVRSIKKLSSNGQHANIISFLRTGKLRNTHYYFIDMELCNMNLDQYIYHKTINSLDPSQALPYFITDSPSPVKSHQIWNIMRQIANGVVHLHTLSMAHRDLKPANGTLFFFLVNYQCCIR